jgi:hypothetical protein
MRSPAYYSGIDDAKENLAERSSFNQHLLDGRDESGEREAGQRVRLTAFAIMDPGRIRPGLTH